MLRMLALSLLATIAMSVVSWAADPQKGETAENASHREHDYAKTVRPIIADYCFKCHGEDRQKGGLRLDQLDPAMKSEGSAATWELALELVRTDEMPPPRSAQPTQSERAILAEWISATLTKGTQGAVKKPAPSLRRLNRIQYTRALQELFRLPMDFGRRLPPDGKSHLGFTNNGEVLRTSPLHLEYFQSIARDALNKAIAAEKKPPVTRYRVTFGKGIGEGKVSGRTGGYQSVPLSQKDFSVAILDDEGRLMNPRDPAEQRELDRVRRKISVGLRGSSRDRFASVEEGVILYGALPHREIAPGAWQGPSPNMKIEMQRVFPQEGNFVMRVEASRGYIVKGHRKLLVDPGDSPALVTLTERSAKSTPAEDLLLRATRLGPWQIAGPILTKDGERARDTQYTPRTGIDFSSPLSDGKTPWRLAGAIDGKLKTYPKKMGAVFLARVINAPSPRMMDLSLGSDDGIWVWLNGEPQLAADVRRGAAPNQNFVSLPLVEGRNELLIKIVNFGGDFGSYVRDLHDGTQRSFAPYRLDAAKGARVIEAERSRDLENLRFVGATLVPKDVPAASKARVNLGVTEGYWQFDLVHPVAEPNAMASVRLEIGELSLDTRPQTGAALQGQDVAVTPIGTAYLSGGNHVLTLGGPFFAGFSHIIATPLSSDHALVKRLEAQAKAEDAQQIPELRAFIGTRTDDGMDYATFGEAQKVLAPRGAAKVYEFHGRLEDLPIPEPDSGDDEILSGICVLGVWNDHLVKTAGDPGPPLLIKSLEFEAPFFAEWPPPSHRAIFHESLEKDGDEEAYAKAVFAHFLPRAYRRPLAPGEIDRFIDYWREDRANHDRLEDSLKEGLVAALCSPSFLFHIEVDTPRDSGGRIGEDALASRLAFFLWNSPPDDELSDLARQGELRAQLMGQVDRMINDPRSRYFTRTFTHEWLRLDRLQDMTIDAKLFPSFTRFVKRDMEKETVSFFDHVLRQDLSLLNLIDSDFVLLNQNLAEFYGVEGVRGSEFRPVALPRSQGRGGLLSQGAFLAGHSDGSEPHPIKRAVWVKEKLLGRAPLPPPPNVPDLDPTVPGFDDMTLKEKIEQHRSQPACMDCHASFDSYGIALETYNAVGLKEARRKGRPVDAKVELPDGTAVDGAHGLKRYLLEKASDQFAASLIKHLFSYALGRDLGPWDEGELSAILNAVQSEKFAMRALIRAIVSSPSFRDQ